MYMCIVLNTYRIGKVCIEYVSYWLLTVSSQRYDKGVLPAVNLEKLVIVIFFICLMLLYK